MTATSSDPALQRVIDKCAAGERLDSSDGLVLFETHDVVGLGHLANDAKERRTGPFVAFVLNRQVNPTNVCVLTCKFCDYAAKLGDDHAYEMSLDQIRTKVDAPIREVHVVGGMHPDWPFERYVEILRVIRETNPTAQISLIKDLGQQFVIGADPFEVEKLWQRIFASRHDYRHPGLDSTPALSAIEMACWDIIGKAVDQPIYNLLGGKYHEKLRAYAYMPTEGIWETPEKAGDIAAKLVEEGNTACKLDPFMPAFPIPRDIPLNMIKRAAKVFESIRDAV